TPAGEASAYRERWPDRLCSIALARTTGCRSSANQARFPLVDQDIGDDRRTGRPQPAARLTVAGLQFAKLLTARWGSEQGLQFLLALHERLAGSIGSPFPKSGHSTVGIKWPGDGGWGFR